MRKQKFSHQPASIEQKSELEALSVQVRKSIRSLAAAITSDTISVVPFLFPILFGTDSPVSLSVYNGINKILWLSSAPLNTLSDENSETVSVSILILTFISFATVNGLVYRGIINFVEREIENFINLKPIEKSINSNALTFKDAEEKLKSLKSWNKKNINLKSYGLYYLPFLPTLFYAYRAVEAMGTNLFKPKLLRGMLFLPNILISGIADKVFSYSTYYQENQLQKRLKALTTGFNGSEKIELKTHVYEQTLLMLSLEMTEKKLRQSYYSNKNTDVPNETLTDILYYLLKKMPGISILNKSQNHIYISHDSFISENELIVAKKYLQEFVLKREQSSKLMVKLRSLFEDILYRPIMRLFLPEDKNGLPTYIFTIDISNLDKQLQGVIREELQILFPKSIKWEDDILQLISSTHDESQNIQSSRDRLVQTNRELLHCKKNEKPKSIKTDAEPPTVVAAKSPKVKTRSSWNNHFPFSLFTSPAKKLNVIKFERIGKFFDLDHPDDGELHRIELPYMRESNKLLFFEPEQFINDPIAPRIKLAVEKPILDRNVHRSKMTYHDSENVKQQASFKLWWSKGEARDVRVPIREVDIGINPVTDEIVHAYKVDAIIRKAHKKYERENTF